jgi:ABC-2 type transport system ATP-binding protein
MDILKTHSLTKRYRKTVALDKVNITIQQGDIYGFIGKNGAGKTTLIRVITGIAEPTSGGFALFGENDPRKLPRLRKRMAAVVESPALHLNLSAYQNLKLQCILLGLPQPHHQAIEAVLLKVDLASLLIEKNKKAKNFSLGMRQRLGIAMALLSNPEFLILDEPNNGLDPEGIRDLRELLLKLNQQEGLTLLISSHMLTELAKLATRYGFIDRGKLIKEISAETLLKESKQVTILTINKNTFHDRPLRDQGLKDFSLQGNQIVIEGNQSMNPYLVAIAAQGLEVTNMTKQSEDLEAFFMKMIQGGQR